eukprot:2806012-Pyramimonas_sp.AAC.1
MGVPAPGEASVRRGAVTSICRREVGHTPYARMSTPICEIIALDFGSCLTVFVRRPRSGSTTERPGECDTDDERVVYSYGRVSGVLSAPLPLFAPRSIQCRRRGLRVGRLRGGQLADLRGLRGVCGCHLRGMRVIVCAH